MAAVDVSLQRASLLSDTTALQQLPPELLHIIQDHQSHNLLDAVAAAALIPQLTGPVLAHFETVFADICARWLLSSTGAPLDVRILTSFARVLPFAPSLSVFLQRYLTPSVPGAEGQPLEPLNLSGYEGGGLLHVLLAIWRLNSFDRRTYGVLSKLSQIQALFKHEIPAVRYLAIRIFCQLLEASDFKLQALIEKHIQKDDSLLADFDGRETDFTFLSLYEHSRAKEVHELCQKAKIAAIESIPPLPPQKLTSLVINYGSSILPRPLGPVHKPSSLVLTPTTLSNLERLVGLLQRPGPILLHGLSGAGKTSLVHEVARELGKDGDLVTLHLNDQTDAKMLLGLYTTDSKPGSFQWRPGVLTTAVKEGRWVLIEDLDRAPTEVMSTLLPLIEHGELLIPSRGERIQAGDSFRVFATVRTSLGMNGQENLPGLVALRLWQLLSVQSLPETELRDVINGSYPLLHKYAPGILSVFGRLLALSSGPSSLSLGRGVIERPINARDLLKWCRRMDRILTAAGCRTGEEPISETTRDWLFMEAVDCFVSSVKEPAARTALIGKIAEEMHLSPERVQHYLSNHVPKLEVAGAQLHIGRATMRKTPRPSRVTKHRRPFATTTHAKRLLEQVAVAVRMREPVLLVGETGIGKTTVVQQLAESLGHKLLAVNLSQQSEAGDLLGGFKPVNSRSLAVPLKEEFEDLFEKTGVSAEKNQDYLDRIGKRFAKGRWSDVAKEWRKAPKMFETIVAALRKSNVVRSEEPTDADGQPAKRRKTESSRLQRLLKLKPRWESFSQRLEQFERQLASGSGSFAFAFVEGNIVKAARNGDWVLLDEINLASPDTLESIADLLHSGPEGAPSILLSETGEIERVHAHPDFRVFGAMNPATDVGKRDLPLGLRSRFTEIYVPSPDKDKKDLLTIVKTYLSGNNSRIDQVADSIADLYLEIKSLAESKVLVDGANEVPHFSLRTLTRVLTYANDVSAVYGLERALYEGFCMGFLTLLSQDSEKEVMPRIHSHLLKRQNVLSQPPKRPADGRDYVSFKNQARDHQYWVLQGGEARLERPDYIITPYVERNLLNLVRATSTRRYPILIQGPTSAGKTSMVEYLANFSGNKFVRINNHEHTDLQEYLGTYVSGNDGKLKFQEGLLVQAMRQGSWIVLDELNLAPTDVLEALNRLLDDNRELLIPETQEIVRPHENFMLFATQNPPGLYGGRKALSRAFRNRFLELHFDDIPENELETILQRRSRNTAPSDCRRIVAVYKELSRLRQESRVFEQKNSFATLRDLFRWAMRDADNREQVAGNGFMLLAERVRKEEERLEVKKVIEDVFRVRIDLDALYDGSASPGLRSLGGKDNSQGVVWTKAMRRLFVLVERAAQNNEPVLLVGETGCGKTTVCQLLAEARQKELYIVNAHQNTETGDLIGSQRPVRNRGAVMDALRRDLLEAARLLGVEPGGPPEQLPDWYQSLPASEAERLPRVLQAQIDAALQRARALFEWCDGSLVHAMKMGQLFLLDEISLADDSVLERLNSVLEPQRSLLLAEKGIDDSSVTAAEGFQFFATMNPGGDFGKKELSPALRNRFTEIWVPALSEDEDVLDIVSSKLARSLRVARLGRKSIARIVVEFTTWFGETFRPSSSTAFSLRDILAWVTFMNGCGSESPEFALLHGAATVFIDTLGANPSALIAIDPRTMDAQRQLCLDKLSELSGSDLTPLYRNEPQVDVADGLLRIGDFGIERRASGSLDGAVEFRATTTKMNAMRVIRALQINKPVLLEGSPGVGKTTLVGALSRACGRPLTRINLSDQTDLMDLFGTDVPVEGAEAGNFAWKDAPFLQAMQKGGWVLLDEMNLASQSVLEGLNACLDHRGEVYISELDQVFKRHPDFRLFAAQNPHHQGGGRKGLPSSFVNRFIVVYADVFTEQDLLLIAQSRAQGIPPETVRRMISFISSLDDAVVGRKSFGILGSPWEFNLRDTLRWLDLLVSADPLLGRAKPDDLLDMVIRQRFRTERDREEVTKLFSAAFRRPASTHSLYHDISDLVAQVGIATLPRSIAAQPTRFPSIDAVPRLAEIESLMIAVKQDLPCILVGPSGSGKSALLRHVAALAGKALTVFPLNADVDTMDLIGGFEQSDPHRELQACLRQLRTTAQDHILSALPSESNPSLLDLVNLLDAFSTGDRERGDVILRRVELLSSEEPGNTSLSAALSTALATLLKPLTLENPRFEWLDGVIVRAIENGEWLVLDNANLCSASVLDRLNSLLERPDGFLSVNEHSGPGGEPRVVRPHPDFRIFLTMDPRYGELSRAMRNRSVEIYLDSVPPQLEPFLERITPIEADLRRFHTAHAILEALPDADRQVRPASHALDILSTKDAAVLARFATAVDSGLFGPESRDMAALPRALSQLLSYVSSKRSRPVFEAISQLHHSVAANLSPSLSKAHLGVSAASHEMLSSYLGRLRFVFPIHPLENTPALALLDAGSQDLAHWLAVCYENVFEVQSALEAMESQRVNINVTKPSSLNRFQRSSVSDQVAAVSKDSTVHVSQFLSSVLGGIDGYVREHLGRPASSWAERRLLLRKLMHYWRRTFTLACDPAFDEALFQAHLGQGLRLWKDELESMGPDTRDVAASFLRRLEADFVVGFKLLTGLSMEALWYILRPQPIRDARCLEQVAEMQRLAARFDALRWKAQASVHDLSSVLESLSRAYAIIRTSGADAADLVGDLTAEVSSLESRIGEHAREQLPFFSSSFESLRQVLVLHQVSGNDTAFRRVSDVTVLSNLPTLYQMRLQNSLAVPSAFQPLDYALAQDSDSRPWTGTVSESLLLRFDAARHATLAELRSLEEELPIMGRALVEASEALSTDPIAKLNSLLSHLIMDVTGAHGDPLRHYTSDVYDALSRCVDEASVSIGSSGLRFDPKQVPHLPEPPSSEHPHLSQIFRDHLLPSLIALTAAVKGVEPRSAYASLAWVHFAQGCVKLYVPDKVFDPYLRAQVELDFHEQLLRTLDQSLSSLSHVGRCLTGQRSDLRCVLLEDEIKAIGAPPPSVQTIFRPAGSELMRLQGEFNNVLNTVVRNDVASFLGRYLSGGAQSDAQELQLVRDNIARLIERLSGQFDAYQDLTLPLVNFLRCLQIGLSLSESVSTARSQSGSELLGPSKIPAYLDGSAWAAEPRPQTRNLEFLSLVSSVVSVEGRDGLSGSLRQPLFDSLAFFYEEWSKKLQADRKAEEQKQSLYRFRGSLEDDEEHDREEFNELFPDYDNDDGTKKSPGQDKYRARDLSVMVAEAHARIFLSRQDEQESLRDLCKQAGRKVSAENRRAGARAGGMDKLALTPALLVFDEQFTLLRSASQPSLYNFYTDAHISEVRKLLVLVGSVKSRFQDLQGVDEIGHHQILSDVITACDKLLEFSVDEPLARFIIAVESLHAFVYEWQEGGWASHVHKATPLYERLTSTIHDWRRLELSSWAKLFDMEEKKCRDEARSWWFIAYGALVVQPCLKTQDGQDLRSYAVELLHTLESYFSDAVAGQFSARLSLLRQLKNQLDLLVQEAPALAVVRDAAQNFISVYSRYEQKAAELIRAGRAPLDRKMKDVLLMFSWQDRNIVALRESSRKSHHKLFKLVRKFRDVLGRPMKSILDQGLPDQEFPGGVPLFRAGPAQVDIDSDSPSLCSRLVPTLSKDPHWQRLSNPAAVIKVMDRVGSLPQSVVEAAQTTDSFVTDLLASMASLKKETPALLTDDNKEDVKHLKNRKTRLFVDTLKTIRQMGFSRNLSTNLLEQQRSTAVVLADSGVVGYFSSSDPSEMEYYYHKFVDLAARVRAATLEHSDDLSRDAVERSVGYLEGILHTAIQQRRSLCQPLRSLGLVEQAIAHVAALSSVEQGPLLASDEIRSSSAQALRWLPQILKFCVHLINTHARLGGGDNRGAAAELEKWAAVFEGHSARQGSQPKLPAGFGTPEHSRCQAQLEEDLGSLQKTVASLLETRPDLAFIIEHVEPWAVVKHAGPVDADGESTLDGFVDSIMTLSKKLLVAIQEAEKAGRSLPTSTEDPAWLMHYSGGLVSRIRSLRMEALAQGVNDLVHQLRCIDLADSAIRQSATALLRVILPLFQQYASVCKQNISTFADLHRALCRMGYNLAKSFLQIASHGFCTPKEKSDEQSEDSGQLESGTGLGEGEGAEDISKDIQPDEDLSELAQEPNEKKDGDMEDQEDAVDMGTDDLEGDLGSVGGKDEEDEDGSKHGDEEEDDDEMDEEAGDVDDLDPTAVDEKMWDGDDQERADKDQQGDDDKGAKDDEQVAANEGSKQDDKKNQPEEAGEQGEEEDEEDEAGAEQEETAAHEDLNNQDQNVQDNETLALPDDMELDVDDGEEGSETDDDMDKLSDVEERPRDEDAETKLSESGGDDAEEQDGEDGEQRQEEAEADAGAEEEEEEEIEGTAEGQDSLPDMDLDEDQNAEDAEEKDEKPQPSAEEVGQPDQDNAAPSDVQAGGGQAETEMDGGDDEPTQSKASQREQGDAGESPTEEDKAAGNEGSLSKADQEQQPDADKAQDASKAHPFKKLGDTLERWHRTQRDIQAADEDQGGKQDKAVTEAEMARSEFQHLQDEDAPADTQAMGGATDDEVRPVDDAMAIDTETDERQNQVLPDDAGDEEMEQDKQGEAPEPVEPPQDNQNPGRDDGRSGVVTRQGAYDVDEDEDDAPSPAEPRQADEASDDEQVQETSTQLSTTHITEGGGEEGLLDYSEALRLWNAFQTKTHALSLSLTSQLRLILTPSQSTKLSGSFRTGKRLNIKKIIPYIASSYKRDKIWMRRSVPTKRAYQILLCVDDSRSMGDPPSAAAAAAAATPTPGALAIESLVMVSRSLAMLEAGQVGVLGFGATVFAAHDLAAPFSTPDAGARALQRLTFRQDATDVARLLRAAIDRFRLARLQQSQPAAAADLWQLALVLSDGLTPSAAHARIRPLLREAAELRIMVVFVVLDGARAPGESVLELKEARFTPDGDVVVDRYLDSFPFPYYLIVHHLEDLPGALAGLLRTWFAEVNS